MGDFETKSEIVSTPPPAEERITEKADSVHTGSSKIAPPFTEFEKVKGVPYGAEYFGISGLWPDLQSRKENTPIARQIAFIEKFVSSEIVRRQMTNETKNYDGIVDTIKGQLHLTENDAPDKIISRVHDYMKVMEMQIKLDAKRERLWNAIDREGVERRIM